MRTSTVAGTLPTLALTLLMPVSAEAQAPGLHPNPQYVVPSPNTREISFAAPAGVVSIRREQGAPAIGSVDGAGPTIFGRIVSTAFIDDSTVAIIDGPSQQIRVFSRSGRHQQTFGREGSGPGEFRSPVAVIRSPAGELLVADLRRTIQVFGRGARGFEYRRMLQLPVGVRSMCYLGRSLYVVGVSIEDGIVIRAINDSGHVTAAFGQIYRSPNVMVNYQVAEGRIVCDTPRNLIYYMAGSLLGEVRAFRPTGELVWRVRVSDFLTNRVMDGPGGGTSVERSPTGAHAAGALTLLGDGGLLAQWTFRTPEQMKAKEGPGRIHSIIVNPVTGVPTSLGTNWPLIGGSGGDRLIELTDDPVPQARVVRYSVIR